jgi:capsular exopolysaccharide synthesis family protein
MTEGEVHIEIGGQSVASEAFRKLRTTIQFLGVDRPLRVIQVTSPYAGEGKTTTALNLAASFANAGLRVILVEADLRRPTLHHVFPSDANVGAGLTTALIGSIPIEDAILPTRIENLFHVPAGAIPPNPAELLSSDRMESVLRELRERADVVIVDSPPLLPVADAASVAPRADGVIMIVRSGETHRDRLRQAASLLVKVGGRPLGVVINAVGPQDTYYGYYDYYYSAYSSYSSYRSTPTISETRPTRPRRLGWGKGGAADGRGAMVPAGAVSDSGREGPGPSSSADGAGAVDASEPRPQAAALDGHSAEDELVTGARGAEDATVGREASSAASSTSVPSDSPHPMVQPGAEPEPSAHAASPDKVGQGSSPPDAPEDSLVREPQPSAFTAAVRAAVERAVDEPEEESRE